ncbi:MAG: hypothetical protein F9K30_23515 [Dechloromonas sp.]|nr:MAG: hypothetical protein F9K30_23515 [Dechloromonas sp.]
MAKVARTSPTVIEKGPLDSEQPGIVSDGGEHCRTKYCRLALPERGLIMEAQTVERDVDGPISQIVLGDSPIYRPSDPPKITGALLQPSVEFELLGNSIALCAQGIRIEAPNGAQHVARFAAGKAFEQESSVAEANR